MKVFLRATASFSLVEVTLALGVAGFCLIAVFGLLPIGVQTSQRSISQTAATAVLSSVVADLRATPVTTTTSAQYVITFGTAKTLYFDSAGQFSTTLGTNSRYRVSITFPNGALAYPATYADMKVTWPAPIDPATTTPAGSVEMFAAFDRH
jgi:uncharacterized protein (TIGR02598 family)